MRVVHEELKTAGVRMELEDNGIGDVIEGEDQRSWSFFSGDYYSHIEYVIERVGKNTIKV